MTSKFNIDDLDTSEEDREVFEATGGDNEVADVEVTGVVDDHGELVVTRKGGRFGMFRIAYKNGGQIPALLEGDYTGVEEANSAIELYKAKLQAA